MDVFDLIGGEMSDVTLDSDSEPDGEKLASPPVGTSTITTDTGDNDTSAIPSTHANANANASANADASADTSTADETTTSAVIECSIDDDPGLAYPVPESEWEQGILDFVKGLPPIPILVQVRTLHVMDVHRDKGE